MTGIKKNRYPWWIVAGLVVGGAFWEAQVPLGGEEVPAKPELRILFPADRSVIATGPFAVVAVRPKEEATQPPPVLQVDGTAQPWEPYRFPVLVAWLKPAPGPHQLQIGSRLLRILVRGEEAPPAPPEWAEFRRHPPTATKEKECQSCHEVTSGDKGITLSPPRTPEACDRCHSAEKFGGTHFHPKEPLASCRQCHAVHGSSRPKLLKKPAKELCAACHE